METNLPDLLKEYDQYTIDGKNPSLTWLSKLLKELRKSQIRRPDIVLTWGPKVLSQENYIEALDSNDPITAEAILVKLEHQFPQSSRVKRLQGILYESQGLYSEALEIYDALLKADVSNLFARKRKVTVYKAQNDLPKTIEEINSILHYFPSDVGSWLELGELYLTLNDYDAASHCYEELILLEPMNAHYHCRLAEIFYSIGGTGKILLARKYYTISLTCQNIHYNLRAITGLILSCKQLQILGKSIASETKKKTANTEVATSSSSAVGVVVNPVQLNEHELKVNEELLKWSEEELEKYLSEKKSLDQADSLRSLLFPRK